MRHVSGSSLRSGSLSARCARGLPALVAAPSPTVKGAPPRCATSLRSALDCGALSGRLAGRCGSPGAARPSRAVSDRRPNPRADGVADTARERAGRLPARAPLGWVQLGASYVRRDEPIRSIAEHEPCSGDGQAAVPTLSSCLVRSTVREGLRGRRLRVGSGAAMLDARTVGGGDRADLAAPPKRDRSSHGGGIRGCR